ncbi:MAG: hypothetical protein ACM3L6_05925 [Deltaproteobacteria bacterium]
MAGFYLFLFSLIFIVEGIMLILSPKKLIKLAQKLLAAKEPRLLGLAPLFLGIFLLFSASASALSWLIVLLGLGGIAKAVYLFLTPAAKIKAHPWFALSDNKHRAMGIVVLIVGVLVFISRV